MEKTIYLHIGTVKTGSTAFQDLMRRNYQLLQTEGIFIPKLQTNPVTTPMSEFPNWGLDCIGREIADNGSDTNLQFFLKLFEESGCSAAVLSAETLSGLPLDVISVLASKLKGYKVHPIIVFRHPIALMTSNYCSLTPGSSKQNLSPKQYMKKYIAKRHYVKYGSIVSNCLKLFGSCDVIFYEKEKSILETLFKKMEFSSALISILLAESKSLRISLPPCAALLNHKLSLLCNIDKKNYLNTIFRNLVAFTRTDDFINLRGRLLNNNKEIIVSEKIQIPLIKSLHSELKLLGNTIPETIFDSYFNVLEGTLPTDEEVDEIFSKFILYLSTQNLKNIHSLNHYVLQKMS